MTDGDAAQTFTAKLIGYRTHTPGLVNDHRVELQLEVDHEGLRAIHQAYGLGTGVLEITHRRPEWEASPPIAPLDLATTEEPEHAG